MWKGGMGELRRGTVSGRGWVRRGAGGEEESEGGEKNNGVFRRLVFWILTSQLVCVCVCVCACVCAMFLTKCNDCVLMGDCMHA